MESNSETLAGDVESVDATDAVHLRDWSMSGKQGVVFSGIDLDVPSGGLAIIRGSAGSGKTALLLSIAGRMSVSKGEGRVLDLDLRKRARAVRGIVAVGHVEGLTDVEKDFTVAQHIAERRIMLQPWYKPWVSKSSVSEVIELIRNRFRLATEFIDELPEGTFSAADAKRADFLIDDEGTAFVSELSELQKFILEFGLSSLSRPQCLVIDNIDFLRERADRARAWASLLIYQQLRKNSEPDNPLTLIVSCEDSSELDIAMEALQSDAAPTSVNTVMLSANQPPRH